MNWPDYKDKIKRYFWFSNKELNEILLLSLVFAFIFSFNEWGAATFDISSGIKNLLVAFIIAVISLFVHHSVQRLAALKVGLRPEHKIWWFGILVSLILVIFSNGRVVVLAGCYVLIHMLDAHRLGRFRYGANLKTWGYIALTGPLANIVLAVVGMTINIGLNSVILSKFVMFNFLFAIYNALPIPPLDGSRMFFASRLTYAFFAGAIYSYLLLIYVFGISGLSSILYSLVIGFICGIIFFAVYEKTAWKGP